MKKYYLIVLFLISILSCSQKHITDSEKDFNDGFYTVLNEIINKNFSDVPILVINKTMPVYRTPYGKYPIPKPSIENPPPPPPPGIIYYSTNTFDYFVSTNLLDSISANYMFHSIDSTKIFEIDSSKTNVKLVPESKLIEIFRAHKGEVEDRFEEIKKIYGIRCFISVSTPVFNLKNDKILISVIFRCGYSKNKDYQFVYEKKNEKWIEKIGDEIIEKR